MLSLNFFSKKDSLLPATHYERCPSCKSEDLMCSDPISITCLDCDWTNDEEFVAKGGMDKLMFLYEDDIIKSKNDEAKIMELIKFQTAGVA